MNKHSNLVISGRIRLARNLKGYKFPHLLTKEEGQKLVKDVEDAFFVAPNLIQDYQCHRLWESTLVEDLAWQGNHLISPALLKTPEKSAFILNEKAGHSILINEEDHLRIQVTSQDRDLKELWQDANSLDSLLEARLEWAYDKDLGYLTAYPSNLGTGLRASLMVHLPSLTRRDEISFLAQKLAGMGMTIRGIYGEGSQALGDIYQISNEVTLGISENYIVTNIQDIVEGILTLEDHVRADLFSTDNIALEDEIFRAYGILGNARRISWKEAAGHLSSLRLGMESGYFTGLSLETIDDMIVASQPGLLHQDLGLSELLNEEAQEVLRASVLRKHLERAKADLQKKPNQTQSLSTPLEEW